MAEEIKADEPPPPPGDDLSNAVPVAQKRVTKDEGFDASSIPSESMRGCTEDTPLPPPKKATDGTAAAGATPFVGGGEQPRYMCNQLEAAEAKMRELWAERAKEKAGPPPPDVSDDERAVVPDDVWRGCASSDVAEATRSWDLLKRRVAVGDAAVGAPCHGDPAAWAASLEAVDATLETLGGAQPAREPTVVAETRVAATPRLRYSAETRVAATPRLRYSAETRVAATPRPRYSAEARVAATPRLRRGCSPPSRGDGALASNVAEISTGRLGTRSKARASRRGVPAQARTRLATRWRPRRWAVLRIPRSSLLNSRRPSRWRRSRRPARRRRY